MQLKDINLLQDFAYARAVAPIYGQTVEHGLIQIDGQAAGFVQVFKASILDNFIQAIIIDRGPLWFSGFGTDQHFEAFIEALRGMYPKRFAQKLRLIAEHPPTPRLDKMMKAHGFKKQSAKPYETVMLNLDQDEEHLKKACRKSWRQSLAKAEKSNLKIRISESVADLPNFLNGYQIHKQEKNYAGTKPRNLFAIAKSYALEKNMILGFADIDNECVAAMLILKHGSGATYQAAWSADTGKAMCANHLLLWQGALHLKQQGVRVFDLGGVNDQSAKGLKIFKTGMGGTLYSCAGLYTG